MRIAASLIPLLLLASRVSAQASAPVAPAVTLHARPLVHIPATADDGTLLFGTAAWATRLADGRVAIADGADLAIRLFGADGRQVLALGREGRGPGEFTSLGWVGTCGTDTLFAWDYVIARMTVLDPARGRVRDWTNTSVGGPQATQCSERREWAFVTRFSRTEKSQPVLNTATASGYRYRLWSDTLDVAVVDADGREIRTLVDQAFRESNSVNFPDGRFMAIPRQLGLATLVDWIGDTLVLVNTVSGAVRLAHAHTGGAERFRVANPDRRRPTPADRDAVVEAVIRRSLGGLADHYRTLGRELPMPDLMPAVHGLAASRDGRAWFVTSPPGDRTTELVAYTTAGRLVARLTVPKALVVFEIGADYLLGRTETEEGEQEVVLWRLDRR